MYKIKFKCKELTGTKIHSIMIDDDTLSDTWSSFDVGDVKNNEYINIVRAKSEFTHDVNVWYDDSEIKLSLYKFNINTLDDEYIQTDTSDWIRCEIISIEGSTGDATYCEIGGLFYDCEYDECEDCGDLVYETVNGLCESCQHIKGWL